MNRLKAAAILMAMVLMMGTLTACGGEEKPETNGSATKTEEEK